MEGKEKAVPLGDMIGTASNTQGKNNLPTEFSQGSSASYQAIARRLFDSGLEPIPIAPGQKYPTLKGWPTCSLPIDPWPKDHGIGLRTGKSVIGIDIDVYDKNIVDDIIDFLFPQDKFLVRVGQPPKALIPVRCPAITSKLLSESYIDAQGVINRVEILSTGQQFVAFGIHPETGKPYEWSGDPLLHSLPTVDERFINEVIGYFQGLAIDAGWLSVSKADRVKKIAETTPRQVTGDEPGSVYNRSVSIETILENYGWIHFQGPYWTRPGKHSGISGAVHGDIFWCFTTSTILQGGSRKEDRCFYDAFELLTQYEFGGDKSACAQALRAAMREAA